MKKINILLEDIHKIKLIYNNMNFENYNDFILYLYRIYNTIT